MIKMTLEEKIQGKKAEGSADIDEDPMARYKSLVEHAREYLDRDSAIKAIGIAEEQGFWKEYIMDAAVLLYRATMAEAEWFRSDTLAMQAADIALKYDLDSELVDTALNSYEKLKKRR